MASIVATPLPALGVVKVIVDWTPTYDSDLVTVYRITPDNVFHEVIGSPVYLSDGLAILYDSTAPFDVALRYRALVINPVVARDDFNRSFSPGWGNPELGAGPYVVRSGASSNFQTFASSRIGQISVEVTNANRIISLPTTYLNVEVETSALAPTVVPASQPLLSSIFTRFIDNLNYYQFSLVWLPNGTVEARIYRRQTSPSTLVVLGAVNIGSYSSFQEFRMVARTNGTSLQLWAWQGTRPWTPTLSVNDSVQANAGYPAWGAHASTGFAGTLPTNLAFRNIVVRLIGNAQLNTVGTVTLVAGRDGWLRDPQNPPSSVRMDNCASHTLECLNADRFVFFQGIDEGAYASATGVFDVIDAANPLTVAQTRKSEETSLRVVSTTLADIPPLNRLFSTGRDLLVSLPADYGWGIETYGSEAVTVGDVRVSRLNRRDMRKPQRLWSLPVRVTDQDETFPSGATGSNNIPVTGATFGDMKATGLTYGQLKAGGKRYIDWAQGDFT